MRLATEDAWLDEFVTTAGAARAGTLRAFHRARHAGQFVTLIRGVHLPAHVWQRLDADAQMRARVHAAALATAGQAVFCGLAAAAIWRLPMVGSWPDKAEVLREPTGGGRTRQAFVVRSSRQGSSTETVDRVTVTPLARTVADVARTRLLGTAVAMADASLSTHAGTRRGPAITRGALDAELVDGPRAGSARLRRVLELADGNSGSPGESVSRVAIHLEGLPAPVLQHPFRDRAGLVGVVDFWWPEFELIGEFDGRGKYSREDMLDGSTPADAVIAEKRREDRLRALGPRVVRWGWESAISPPRLARVLRDAGLR
jgi:hypothetical protein